MNNFFSFINEEINYASIKGGPKSSATKEYIIQALKNNKIYDKVDTSLYLKFLDKGINTDWIDRFIKHAAEIVLHGKSAIKYGDLIKGRERAYGGSAPVYKEMMMSLGFENTGNTRNVSWELKKNSKIKTDEIKPTENNEPIKLSVNMTDNETGEFNYRAAIMSINGIKLGKFGSYGYGTIDPEAMSNILKSIIGDKNTSLLKTRIKNTDMYRILFGKVQAGNWARPDRIYDQQDKVISTLKDLILILNKEFGTNISTSVGNDSSDYTKLENVKAVEIKPSSNPKEKEIKETISKLQELLKTKRSYNNMCVEINDYIKRKRLNESEDVNHIYYEMNRDSLDRSISDAIRFYENLIK